MLPVLATLLVVAILSWLGVRATLVVLCVPSAVGLLISNVVYASAACYDIIRWGTGPVTHGVFEVPLQLACWSHVLAMLPTLRAVAIFGPGWVRVLHFSLAELPLPLQLSCCSRMLFMLATLLVVAIFFWLGLRATLVMG